MSIQIPDTFDNIHGFSNYGTTYDNEAPPSAILTNRHVDVRIFDLNGITRPRVMSDLDGDLMSDLDTTLMSELESVLLVPGEHFVKTSGTGAIIDTTADATYAATIGVGKFGTYKGWRGLRLRCNGAALTNLIIDSDWPTGGGAAIEADISAMNTFSVLVDQSAMAVPGVITSVKVTFNNDPNGVFGGATDSTEYTLSLSGKNWTGNITTMMGSPGGCDFTQITGVRLKFSDNTVAHPVNNDLVYVLGMRAYVTGFVTTPNVDVNTKRGTAVQPVTLDLATPSDMVPMIRGTEPGLPSDPRPLDSTTSLLIKTGDLKFGSVGSKNTAYLYFREDTDTSSYIQLRVGFYYDGTTKLQIGCFEKVATVTTNNLTLTLSNGLLNGSDYFIFEGTVKAHTFRVRLWDSDAGGSHRSVLYDSGALTPGLDAIVVSGTPLDRHRGRVGWRLVGPDRDVSLFAFSGSGLAYSTLITSPASSFEPVDGVQLTAAFSQDDNLFQSFSGSPFPVIDTQRALSADGSYRGTGPMESNSFFITTEPDTCYLDFDIWVPSQVATGNQPRLVLRSPDESTSDVVLPPLELQGNQWNHIMVELAGSAMLTNVIYRLFIERSEGLGTTYEWNVDNMVIGVRNVRWSACADLSDTWIDFRDTVNDADGGLHFPNDKRGTQLQIKAEALTEQAWVAPFSFRPHYAELGKPTFHH